MRWVRTTGGRGAVVIVCGGTDEEGEGETRVRCRRRVWGDRRGG